MRKKMTKTFFMMNNYTVIPNLIFVEDCDESDILIFFLSIFIYYDEVHYSYP